MSRRACYHAAGRNDLEFELYSKQQPDISWAQNRGFQVGAASIKKYYVDQHAASKITDLARMSKFYPESRLPEPYATLSDTFSYGPPAK